MQTVVNIPDDLYHQAELTAARQGVALPDLIAQGLRLALSEARPTGGQRITFPLLHSARSGALGTEEVRAAQEIAAEQEDAARASSM
jgi:hypothetical protein